MSEEEFKKRYRLAKFTVRVLVGLLNNNIVRAKGRSLIKSTYNDDAVMAVALYVKSNQIAKMNKDEELQQNNMISNLPLLFANGYPTTLEKMTEVQLEKFIPFMVQCSLGHINLGSKIECSKPEWWPESLYFSIPLTKPRKYLGSWIEKLKDIVFICYQFHKSVFLLRFCYDLSLYEQASLRFINNHNSTTSLFDRRCNKLLVTFRNENMSYDQPQRQRKCLLQHKTKTGQQSTALEQMMVEAAPFDIYLCDNCDAELYSPEAMLEHEKTCRIDDDVILCDTPELAINGSYINESIEQNDTCSLKKENIELCEDFLLNLNLKCIRQNKRYDKSNNTEVQGLGKRQLHTFIQQDQAKIIYMQTKRRITRRSRAVHSMSRDTSIALSSPAGQLLLHNTKSYTTPDYLNERLERIERFCYTPLLSKINAKPKYLDKRIQTCISHCSFKKPPDYSNHLYNFPRRQFSQKRRDENFRLLNSSLLKRCRPMSVRLKKISNSKIKSKQFASSSKLNIKLTRDNLSGSKWKISSAPSTEIIMDTIDLCTSDDEDGSTHCEIIQNDQSHHFDTTLHTTNHNQAHDDGEEIITRGASMKSIDDAAIGSSLNYSQNNQITEHSNSSTITTIRTNSNAATPCKQINSVKSLLSSVYILSNYVSNPLAAIVSASSSVNTQNNNHRNQTNVKLLNNTNSMPSNNNSMWYRRL